MAETKNNNWVYALVGIGAIAAIVFLIYEFFIKKKKTEPVAPSSSAVGGSGAGSGLSATAGQTATIVDVVPQLSYGGNPYLTSSPISSGGSTNVGGTQLGQGATLSTTQYTNTQTSVNSKSTTQSSSESCGFFSVVCNLGQPTQSSGKEAGSKQLISDIPVTGNNIFSGVEHAFGSVEQAIGSGISSVGGAVSSAVDGLAKLWTPSSASKQQSLPKEQTQNKGGIFTPIDRLLLYKLPW